MPSNEAPKELARSPRREKKAGFKTKRNNDGLKNTKSSGEQLALHHSGKTSSSGHASKKPPHSKWREKKGPLKEGKSDGGVSKMKPPSEQLVAHSFRKISPRATNGIAPRWTWVEISPSGISSVPPLVSVDTRYFFVIYGQIVKIYSHATGRVVSSLSIPDESSSEDSSTNNQYICSLLLNPHNPYQLYVATFSGKIHVWDYLEAVLLQTFDIGVPIYFVRAHSRFEKVLFVACAESLDSYAVRRVTLQTRNSSSSSPAASPRCSSETVMDLPCCPAAMAISSSGSSLIVATDNRIGILSLETADDHLNDGNRGVTVFETSNAITVLACHPTKEIFATGNEAGAIQVWFCLDKRRNRGIHAINSSSSILHWHAQAVRALTFTRNGAYLLSGGEEAVLVLWEWEARLKNFLPRLGAAISSIVVVSANKMRDQECIVRLADGTMLSIDTGALTVVRSLPLVKITHSPSTQDSVYFPLDVHPLTSYFIMPSSHPSSLQMYSRKDSEMVSELEVSPSNRVVTPEARVVPARVTHVAISRGGTQLTNKGEWMATIDHRPGGTNFAPQIVLRIWLWDHQNGNTFSLNTRFDRPHATSEVTSISFNPVSADETCLLVTTGADGTVRFWSVKSQTDKSGDVDLIWSPRSRFNFRNQIPTKAVWSPDGSLVAVAFGQYVTLWDSLSNTLLGALTCAEVPLVLDLCFVGRNGRQLAAAGSRGVVLWDVISRSMCWHFAEALRQPLLCAHPENDYFVLIRSTGDAYSSKNHAACVFGISSPSPLRTRVLPGELASVRWDGATEASSSPDGFSLVGLTADGTVVALGDEINSTENVVTENASLSSVPVGTTSRPTLFEHIFGESVIQTIAQSASSIKPPKPRIPAHISFNLEPLEGPSHLLPPMDTLFDSLIQGFIGIRSEDVFSTQPKEKASITETDNIELDNETENPLVSLPPRRQVDDEELDTFTEFFKAQSLATRPTSPGSPRKQSQVSAPHVNGKAHNIPNGVGQTHKKASDTPVKIKVKSPSTSKLAVTADGTGSPGGSTQPSPSIGQKRKTFSQ